MRVWVAGATTALLIVAIAADWIASRPRAFDPNSLSDAGRGVVIDGICPADVGAVRVDSDYTSSDWAIKGTAYPGLTVIRWEVPDVRGLDGYLVARLSYGRDWQLDADSKRTFAISDIAHLAEDYAAFADSEGVQPGTRYWYQVFPVVAGELGRPSPPLQIWSPPEKPPLTPVSIDVVRQLNGEIEVEARAGFHRWKQGIRVARRELGETNWQVVHDPLPPPGFDWEIDESHRWVDEDVEPGKEYEYAVCQTNARGASKAMIASTAPAILQDVSVDPPRNIRAVQTPIEITVFWEPAADSSVVGYRVERVVDGEDGEFEHRRFKITSDRAENFVEYHFSSMPRRDSHRFRVRTVTDEGMGPWSTDLVVDSSQSATVDSGHRNPKIESISARYDVVFLVWSAADIPDDTAYRILRRDISRGGEWEFFIYRFGGIWVDEDGFDWDFHTGLTWNARGWTDEIGIRPDTEYEYASQLKRGGIVEPPSEPVSVRTRPLPKTSQRLPMSVHDLEAEKTDDGVQLTWAKPDDPTLRGLLVSEVVFDRSVRWLQFHYTPLAPGTTRYLFRNSDALVGYPVCLFVQTFNDHGLQDRWRQSACLESGELNDCVPTQESVRGSGENGNPEISFDGCETMSTYVLRHELTIDGFETRAFVQPCRPSFRSDWGHQCRYEDDDIKPSTWYLYELRQVSQYGEVSKSTHEFLTLPEQVNQ